MIDAGDASIVAPPANDQRGAPFLRIADGDGNGSVVIDIGSHEVQAPSPADADFDGDGDVDGTDFLSWQRGFGIESGATLADGDSDQDEDVDGQDLTNWSLRYGLETLASATQSSSSAATVASRDSLIDLAMAVELSDDNVGGESLEPLLQPAAVTEFASRESAFAAIAQESNAETPDDIRTAGSTTNEGSAESPGELTDEWVVTAL